MLAAVQRFFLRAVLPLVNLPVVRSAIEIIHMIRLVEVSVLANVPLVPRRVTVNMSSSPRNDAAAVLVLV